MTPTVSVLTKIIEEPHVALESLAADLCSRCNISYIKTKKNLIKLTSSTN